MADIYRIPRAPEDLVGKLVLIVDLEAQPLWGKTIRLPEASDGVLLRDDPTEQVFVNGQQGVCLRWLETEKSYFVRTFDNVIALVPMENLEECSVAMPEQGGFDFVWPPAGFGVRDFAFLVASCISDKGFCIVQMFAGAEDRAEMLREASSLPGQHFAQEIHSAYLGVDSNTKASISEKARKTDSVPVDAMSSCEHYLTRLSDVLKEPGFTGAGRTPTFLRTSYESAGEKLEFAPIKLDETVDREEQLKAYLEFTQSRTLCMLLMLENQGGNLWLYPKSVDDVLSINIPITQNKLVIFQHNLVDYSYQPVGRSLALQSWLVKGKHKIRAIRDARINPSNYHEVLANDCLPEPPNKPVHVLAFDITVPGNINDNGWAWWAWFSCSGDGFVKVPYDRWDSDMYCDPEQDQWAVKVGKSYTHHGGFVQTNDYTNFDHAFFGFSDYEGRCMLPSSRVMLRTGASALIQSGYTRRSLDAEPIMVHIGDAGPDWGTYSQEWGKYLPNDDDEDEIDFNSIREYASASTTASRLSFVFGMRGRCCQYDTACSSSLTALNAAHSLMMDNDSEEDTSKALIGAINSMFGPSGYLMCTRTQMLSFQGRSFTFNEGADGYGRGEGIGALFMKRDATQDEIDRRVGCVIGSVCGQDGRSASITAPSGPAQTYLINKCFRYGGVPATDYTVTEFHGTGTSLGDPIETGAMQNVQKGRGATPLLVVTTKSHIGHLECSAGIAGITKCMMLLRAGTSPGNCHIRAINANINMSGFPWYFMTECLSHGVSSTYTGVSSFGFCGTDTRVNVFGYAEIGPVAAMKVSLPSPSLPRHAFSQNDDICVCGSWSSWLSLEDMEVEAIDGQGVRTCEVTLGESRVEHFHLVLTDILGDDDDNQMIYPATRDADSSEQVLGPDREDRGRRWKIDGIADGQPVGAKYRISFAWSIGGRQVWWKPSE